MNYTYRGIGIVSYTSYHSKIIKNTKNNLIYKKKMPYFFNGSVNTMNRQKFEKTIEIFALVISILMFVFSFTKMELSGYNLAWTIGLFCAIIVLILYYIDNLLYDCYYD